MNKSASKKGPTTGRPEIDRPKLRQLLYESLQAGTVKWNSKLVHVDDNLDLHFASGAVQNDFDLIVGADGGWSKVRPLLSDVKPFYSGIAGHAFSIPDAKTTQPELYDLVNRGSLFSSSDGKSIVAQHMGDGSLYIGTWSVRPENWQKECGYDVRNPAEVKEACRKDYADWDPRLVAFTQEADDHVAPRDLYMLPIGHKWAHKRGVTLIGDAAHLMTPFAGEGVNLAFEDSLKLSQAIVSAAKQQQQSIQALDKNAADFEQDMFKRATPTQQMTYDLMQGSFMVPGYPRNGIEMYILRLVEGQSGPTWLTSLLVKPLVYAWFFVFKLIW